MSGDSATLAVFIEKEQSSDPFIANASTAVSQTLSKAGFKVVEDKKTADVTARVGVSKVEEPSLIPIVVNGKQLTNNKVTVNVEIVDRDGKAVDSSKGEYTSSDGEADQDSIAELVGKIAESQKLTSYATSSKKEREERKAREEKERREMAEERRAALEREEQAKKEKEARAANQAQINDLEKIRRELDEAVKKGEGALPEDKLKAFKAGVEKLRGTMSNTARAYNHLYTTWIIGDAWAKSEADGAKTVAATLDGELVASGASNGKKLQVAFDGKVGTCYTVVLKWIVSTGSEGMGNLDWAAKGGNTPLQRYSISPRNGGDLRILGTCVTKDVPVTLTSDLTFAGTKNGLRYAVVSSPKTKFPMYIATYMSTDRGDTCDTDAWYSLWTDPVPGSVVYSGKEAFLVTHPDGPGDTWTSLYDVTTGERRAQKNSLLSTPPKGLKFATQFRFPGCKSSQPEGVESIKLSKCNKQMDAKYAPQWDAAEKAKKNAITVGAYRAAQARLEALDKAETAEYDRTCKPIEDAIAKKWEATYNKIVDFYTDKPYTSPIDRAGEMAAQSSW